MRNLRAYRKDKPGKLFSWKRWYAAKTVHYVLYDRTRIPVREGCCFLDAKMERSEIAKTLRAIRAEMRE